MDGVVEVGGGKSFAACDRRCTRSAMEVCGAVARLLMSVLKRVVTALSC